MSSGSVPFSSSPPNSSSTESLDGLKFGQKIYFEDVSVAAQAKPSGGASSSSSSSSSTATTTSSGPKKGRGGGAVQATQPPRCQVEGCKVDLSGAKAYYSRHKVCGMHSKSPTVVVAGLEQRFCQQCSRFHQLPEFDQGKRSCRRRLAGHNERRRKPQPSSLLTSRYARLSSPVFDNARGGGFLMEFASYPKLTMRNALPTSKSSEPVPGNQTASFTYQANSETPSDFFLQGSAGGTSYPGPPRHPAVETYSEVTDSSCALSLLSSQTWGSRNTTPPSVELNNLLNFNGTLMTQLAASSSQAAAIHQLPNASWCLKGIDSGNCSPQVVPDLGLGQISQPLHSHVPGELDVSQGRRHYMDVGQSRACESPHWSL